MRATVPIAAFALVGLALEACSVTIEVAPPDRRDRDEKREGHDRIVDELAGGAFRGMILPRSRDLPGQVVTPGGKIMPLRGLA